MENLLPGQNFCSRLPLEAPTFEEDEAVVVKEETNGAAPAAENGEGRKKKREKRESIVETEKEEEGTNKLIKNWESGGQSSSSPQRQVKVGGRALTTQFRWRQGTSPPLWGCTPPGTRRRLAPRKGVFWTGLKTQSSVNLLRRRYISFFNVCKTSLGAFRKIKVKSWSRKRKWRIPWEGLSLF